MPRKSFEYGDTDDVSYQQQRWQLRPDLPIRRLSDGRQRNSGLGLKVLCLLLLGVVGGYYVTFNTQTDDDSLPPVALNRQATSPAVPAAPADLTPPSSSPEKAIVESSVDVAPPASGLEKVAAASPADLIPPAARPEKAVVESSPDVVPSASEREKSAGASLATTSQASAAERPSASLSIAVSSSAPVPKNMSASDQTHDMQASPTATLPPAHKPVLAVAHVAMLKPAMVTEVQPKPSASERPPTSDIQITQSQACLEVEARQCIGDQSVFPLHEHNKPYIWMNVRSQSPPHILKHVYYHDGRKYAEIPLLVKYPRTRTWSNVTLQNPTSIGSWRVAIVTEDGNLLDQVSFRVTP